MIQNMIGKGVELWEVPTNSVTNNGELTTFLDENFPSLETAVGIVLIEEGTVIQQVHTLSLEAKLGEFYVGTRVRAITGGAVTEMNYINNISHATRIVEGTHYAVIRKAVSE